MHKRTPISVLMTAFNAASFIEEAIHSVLAQSCRDFEFIIVDDGSTDNTLELITSFNDPRIVCLSQENRGIAAALNYGLREAKGEYIARFDADDICYPHRFEKQYQFLQKNRDHIIVGCSVDYIDEHGEFVFTYAPPGFKNEEIQAVKKKTCPFIHSGVMYRKDIVLKKGGYNEHAHCFEDHLLWLAIVEEGKAFNFREPMIKVRLNPGSVSIDERWRPRAFHRIKTRAIESQSISVQDGRQLLKIIAGQNVKEIKEGAYYSLLAKKFLWDNYQPRKARKNLREVISRNWLDWRSYCFFLLSFLPQGFVQKWYRLIKPQANYQKTTHGAR
jgi:glycosyltransferase involved in cell wall biosynthesis